MAPNRLLVIASLLVMPACAGLSAPPHIEARDTAMASPARVIASVPVGDRPEGVATGYGAVWVANHGSGTVSQIDPDTNAVVSVIPVGDGPGRLETAFGYVWITDDLGNALWRIDPATGRTRPIEVGGKASGAPAAAGGAVWLSVWEPPALVRVDPETLDTRHTPLPDSPTGVQFAADSLWVTSTGKDGGAVTRIDPLTGRWVASIPLGQFPWFMGPAATGDVLWVADPALGVVWRIDAKSGSVTDVERVGQVPVVTATDDAVWVNLADAVLHVDPQTSDVHQTLPIGGSIGGVAIGYGAVWVAGFNDDRVWRIEVGRP